MSQVARIKALMQERARAFDATLDVSEGSEYYRTVIAPVVDAMSPDPVDTDALEFIRARLQQEYPTIPTTDADGIIALMAKPFAMLAEPFKADLAHVKLAQSTRNRASLTAAQAQDLAANWLVRPKAGGRSQTTVRIYYASPRTVNVQRTSILSTPSGLNFLPLQPQVVRIESMLVQREGSEYYIDVPVIAEREGGEYDVDVGSITQSAAFAAASRITNTIKARGGRGGETAESLLRRVEASVTERSLTTGRGIVARLNDVFGGLIRDAVPVGAGDPEMQRDLLTGRGEGALLASGVCFVVGQYCLLVSQFEDRGTDGLRAPAAGDEIELNYWSFLYTAATPEQRNETFEIADVLLDTRSAIPALPAVMLFRMSGAPSVASPAVATVPGSHPGVFAAVRGRAVLEITDIPGGVLRPTTSRGTLLVDDRQVHVFGHQDVWVRPASTAQGTAVLPVYPGTPLKEGRNLASLVASSGDEAFVAFDIVTTVAMSAGALHVGDALQGSGTLGYVTAVSGSTVTLVQDGPRATPVAPGDAFTTAGGAEGTFLTVVRDDLGGTELDGANLVGAGYVLEVLSGANRGTYKLVSYLNGALVLDRDLPEAMSGTSYRICRTADVDLFRPSKPVLPFADRAADGLRTAIGSPIVRVRENVQDAGGSVGDTLEILSGPDAGAYVIIEFDAVGGGTAPVLSAPMSATNSGLSYRVYRNGQGVQAPLVRVVPRGVRLLDATGQDTGVTIPYALPLSARPANGLTGAAERARGVNGFVLPDPGAAWAPAGPRSVATGCYTTGCAECVDGAVAIVSVTSTGEMYLDMDITDEATAFFADLRQWSLDIIATFEMGSAAAEFVQGLTPIRLGPPPEDAILVAEYEICLPNELWDAKSNVFVALPDIDWDAEIDRTGSFANALSDFNLGLLDSGFRPAGLAAARPGDTLTLSAGGNAGSYLIERVVTLRVATPGSIVSGDYVEARTYPVTLVVIRDEFPAAPLAGLAEFFAAGVAPLSVPAPPTLPYHVYDMTGTRVTPWALLNDVARFVLQWANALGFDVPSTLALNEPEVLRALWRQLFLSYSTGQPTTSQLVRLRFIEPTSVTVFSPRRMVGERLLAPAEAGDLPSVTGAAHGLTLPHGALTGKAYAVYVRTALNRVVLRGTLPSAVGAASTDETLAAALAQMLGSALDDLEIRDWRILVDVPAPGTLRVTAGDGARYFANADAYLEVDVQDPAGAFATLGFSGDNQGRGTVLPPGGGLTYFPRERGATKLYGASGATRLEFCPAPDLEWVYYPPTPPGQAPEASALPRDLTLTAPPDGEHVATFWVSRLFEPSMQARPLDIGDIIRVHAQRRLLAVAVPEGPAFQVRDRTIGVTTVSGSPVVRLPAVASPQASFTAPQSEEDADAVRVGDLVYLEEGVAAGAYRVSECFPDRLVLNRPVTESTPRILANGNTGVIDLAEPRSVRVPNGGQSGVQDVGNYLTVWGAHHVDVDGAYEILAVQDDGATLLLSLDTSTDFPAAEVGLHWAVTRAIEAPLTSAATSLIDGRTELGAVRPIRVYAGTPTDCTVLLAKATSAQVAPIVVELPDGGVRESVRPPYAFVRPSTYHISSTRMREQGRDRGLYWFDVPVISLGHSEAHNISPDTRTDPAFGSYLADGYWFDVRDTSRVFSSREDTRIVFTGDFLPDTADELFSNRRSAVGGSVAITYDFAPVVDQVQSLLSSTTERNICADSLARHFCPSYVYLDVAVVGGPSPATIASKLYQRIDGMDATDPLDVSALERDLQAVSSYDHPILVQVVTHDLNRRLVESRSSSRIDDETLDANATSRTTYFIPGPDRSALPEDQIPDGERTLIQRGAGRGP